MGRRLALLWDGFEMAVPPAVLVEFLDDLGVFGFLERVGSILFPFILALALLVILLLKDSAEKSRRLELAESSLLDS